MTFPINSRFPGTLYRNLKDRLDHWNRGNPDTKKALTCLVTLTAQLRLNPGSVQELNSYLRHLSAYKKLNAEEVQLAQQLVDRALSIECLARSRFFDPEEKWPTNLSQALHIDRYRRPPLARLLPQLVELISVANLKFPPLAIWASTFHHFYPICERSSADERAFIAFIDAKRVQDLEYIQLDDAQQNSQSQNWSSRFVKFTQLLAKPIEERMNEIYQAPELLSENWKERAEFLHSACRCLLGEGQIEVQLAHYCKKMIETPQEFPPSMGYSFSSALPLFEALEPFQQAELQGVFDVCKSRMLAAASDWEYQIATESTMCSQSTPSELIGTLKRLQLEFENRVMPDALMGSEGAWRQFLQHLDTIVEHYCAFIDLRMEGYALRKQLGLILWGEGITADTAEKIIPGTLMIVEGIPSLSLKEGTFNDTTSISMRRILFGLIRSCEVLVQAGPSRAEIYSKLRAKLKIELSTFASDCMEWALYNNVLSDSSSSSLQSVTPGSYLPQSLDATTSQQLYTDLMATPRGETSRGAQNYQSKRARDQNRQFLEGTTPVSDRIQACWNQNESYRIVHLPFDEAHGFDPSGMRQRALNGDLDSAHLSPIS